MTENKSRIGILGGSFDPPHLGHVISARIVAERLNLNRIILVPTFQQPFKVNSAQSRTELRWEMVEAICAGDQLFEPSRIELDRQEVSYTCRTLELFKKEFRPAAELFWIMGTDNARNFQHWRHPDQITKLAKLVIMVRAGVSTEDKDLSHPLLSGCEIVKTPQLEISSTEIRDRIQQNLPIKFWVGERVAEIISRYGLYR